MKNELLTVHRILIVDDNPAIHDDFRKILCRAGAAPSPALRNLEERLFGEEPPLAVSARFEMDSALQGPDALEKVSSAEAAGQPYSLAFVDLRMPPGWDGIETISRIWAVSPRIQIVICTAYSDYSWEDILRKLGESDGLVILKKPFDNVEVLQMAHTLARKWTLTRQASARMAELDAIVSDRTRDLTNANRSLASEILRRTKTEERLRDSEELFRTAFETTSVAFAIVRANNRLVVNANASFTRLAGRPRSEVCGLRLDDLDLLTGPENWDDIIERLAARGGVSQLELSLRRRDGVVADCLASLETLALHREPHLLLALLDVTERRQLELQLRQAQKMEAVGQLAAGVAHDFNNFLTVMQCHATLHLSRDDLDHDLGNSLHQIKHAAERATALTSRLLAFSRNELVQRVPTDLNLAIGSLREMLQRMIGEAVTLSWQRADEPLCISADESNLEQIILNLMINARDAMPDGGVITVRLAAVDVTAATAHHPEARDGRFARMTVSDTGCGMDAATVSRIFEPFFTTKPVGKGTGLGLATVYGIVKQHQGWIEVETAPGKGARFHVFFPLLPSQTLNPPEADAGPAGDRLTGHGETILVVEDETAVRTFVAAALANSGYCVMEAESGPEALRVWEAAGRKIDLLLTDMIMPHGVNGSMLASQLLARDPTLAVIYSSGYSADIPPPGQHPEGARHLLPKPFGYFQLLRLVRTALDERESGRKSATAPSG